MRSISYILIYLALFVSCSGDKHLEGLALVRIGDKYGFIDTKGNYAINPQFDDAEPFQPILRLH